MLKLRLSPGCCKHRYYKYNTEYGELYALERRVWRFFWIEYRAIFFSVDEIKQFIDKRSQPRYKYSYL